VEESGGTCGMDGIRAIQSGKISLKYGDDGTETHTKKFKERVEIKKAMMRRREYKDC